MYHPAPSGLSEIDSVAELLPAFDFEGLIAHGESGAVHKARQRSLDRDVAIRILPHPPADAKAMAGLSHPNLIRVYDSGEVDGFFYTVMEYVPGKSLRHSAKGKAIDLRQAAEIVMAACEGLALAHESGIFHGALKSADILLTPKCEPKIGNFGSTRQADAATDVFALGEILHELLTGDAHGGVVPDLKLAAICRKATHPDAAKRFPDATALAASLSRWLFPPKAINAPIKRQPLPLQRPKPALAASPGHALVRNCAVIAFLLFSIYALWGFYQAKQERLARLQMEENAKPKVVIVKELTASTSALVRWDR